MSPLWYFETGGAADNIASVGEGRVKRESLDKFSDVRRVLGDISRDLLVPF